MIEDICTNEKYSFTGGPFGSNLKVSDYTKSGVRVIQLNNINDIYFNDDNKVFVSIKKADSLKSCNAYSGDLIFAKMMPAGRLCILPKTYDRYLLGSDAIRLKPNIDKYYCFFLLECLNRTIIRNSITSKTSGSTRHRIGLLDLKKTSFYCPNYAEQKRIGLFFELIESKISIISKKIDILKKYKEGIIKKLIKSSSKVMKLSQLITVCEKTKLQSSYGKTSGKYKFFINSSDEITKWSDDYIFDGEYLILNTGGTAFTNYVNDKFSAMSDCLVVKPNSEYSITIYYWLKAVEKWIDAVGFQGTGLKHLDTNWLLRQKIKIIEYDNKKLSNFNKELNSLIELDSLVLEKLKLIKNIFLNLMFI